MAYLFQTQAQILWPLIGYGHDGDNLDAPLMGDTIYCGTEIPSIIESSGHSLFLKFKTDYHMTAKGFQIEVEAG